MKNIQLYNSILDLSHPITNDMPVFPGCEKPVIQNINTIKQDGYAEKRLTLSTHTGTHMDAPAHIIENAQTLDQLPIDQFAGTAIMVDVTQFDSLSDLQSYLYPLEPIDFILFYTGYSRFWGKSEYFDNFWVMNSDFGSWLAAFVKKGVGVDTPSVDAIDSTELPIHRLLLGKGHVIIENLNLNSVLKEPFFFVAFPLAVVQSDGCSVRAVAMY